VSATVQALLDGEGAVLTVLRGCRAGSSELVPWANLSAEIACAAVRVYGDKPAPEQASVDSTKELLVVLLEAAGQARPALIHQQA